MSSLDSLLNIHYTVDGMKKDEICLFISLSAHGITIISIRLCFEVNKNYQNI